MLKCGWIELKCLWFGRTIMLLWVRYLKTFLFRSVTVLEHSPIPITVPPDSPAHFLFLLHLLFVPWVCSTSVFSFLHLPALASRKTPMKLSSHFPLLLILLIFDHNIYIHTDMYSLQADIIQPCQCLSVPTSHINYSYCTEGLTCFSYLYLNKIFHFCRRDQDIFCFIFT